jgi:hypothetical protein
LGIEDELKRGRKFERTVAGGRIWPFVGEGGGGHAGENTKEEGSGCFNSGGYQGLRTYIPNTVKVKGQRPLWMS